jgi:hypothetical protein
MKSRIRFLTKLLIRKLGHHLSRIYLLLPLRTKILVKAYVLRFPKLRNLLLGINSTGRVDVDLLHEMESKLKMKILRNLIQ